MAIRPGQKERLPEPLARALRLSSQPLLFAGLFSLVSNMLYLSLPIYTTQVYSRVLTSQSGSTLLVLTVGVLFVFLVSSIIDNFRSQVLSSFGVVFDQQLASPTFTALFDTVVRRRGGNQAQALRDLDTVRQAISGPTVGTLFDIPWMPLFMLMLFAVDPWIGLATAVGGAILMVLAFAQNRATREPLKTSSEAAIQSYSFTDAALRNAEVVRALGMLPTLGRQWAELRHISITAGSMATDRGGTYSGAIRLVRMMIQIIIIALGAFLVIRHDIAPGLLFANMILSARALAPVERIVGSWNTLFAAKDAYDRLKTTLADYEAPVPPIQLPTPTGQITVEGVSFAPLGAPALVLINLSFGIRAGEMVGIVGPSGAGKSTLTRLLVGIWKPNTGTVRLDGADVYTWERQDFGRHVGYLPQDTELFAGTVRDNICRFQPDAPDADIIRAAQSAGAHEMILRLSKGYETELGDGGAVLSAGQRQRVGLARTLFGDPKVVILDEPNANLDVDGEAALMKAIEELKARGTTIVLVSHKPAAFALADKLILIRNGTIVRYGPRDEILQMLAAGRQQQPQQPRPTLAEVKS